MRTRDKDEYTMKDDDGLGEHQNLNQKENKNEDLRDNRT